MKKALLTRVSVGLIGLLAFAAVALASGALTPHFSHADMATSTPVISTLAATTTDTSATITWMTDRAATTQIMYGTTTTYTASSTLDTTLVTTHSVTLTSLMPSTTYHFKVFSGNASSTLASSTDQIVTTMSTPATTTPVSVPPSISTIVATPTDTSTTIAWMTDQPATTQVWFGTTTGYGYSSPLDSGFVTNHPVTLTGLLPSTTYHFKVFSANASSSMASSTDQAFMTNTTTPPATTTPDTTALQNEITDLQNRVSALEKEVALLLAGGGGSGTTTPPSNPSGSATVDQNGGTFNAGGSIDFGGRNFGHEESVVITMNGQVVATVHADGGGNFSTGSVSLPSKPGSYTYTFTGQTSGYKAIATIAVH